MAEAQETDAGAGAAKIQGYLDAGFSAQEVAQYKQEQTDKYLHAGFTPKEIDAYWGDTPPDASKLKAYVQGNIGALSADDKAKVANNPAELFRAGLQHGATSLLSGPPNLKAPTDIGLGGKIVYQAGQMVNELPEMAVGYGLGAAGGAGVGGAAASVAGPEAAPFGAAIGAAVGGGAGANALPTAMREILTDYYAHQGSTPANWDDLWSRASAITMSTFKAAAVGGISNVAGAGASRVIGGVGGGAVARTAGNLATQTAVATTTGAALEGQVPTLNDFITGAALAISMTSVGAAGHFVGARQRFVPTPDTIDVAANERDIYVKTGMDPKMISQHIPDDPALLDEVLAPRTADGTIHTPGLHALAPPEPAPFKPEPQVPAPEVRRPQIAFGDSLAVGTQRHAGMFGTEAPFEGGEDKPGTARIGASTSEVLRRIDDSNPEDVRGIDVLLSTGASNSPSRLDVIPAQIQALKDKGARSISIMGVGTNPHLAGINDQLQKIADAAGGNVHFIGPLKHVGSDGIHSTNYRDEISGTVGSHMAPQTAAQAPQGEVAPGEPETPAPRTPAPAAPATPKPGTLIAPTPEAVTPEHLQLFRTLEGNRDGHSDHAVSPAGAVGRNQILPTTASEYGFDPSRLQDPDYNDGVAKAIISDLSRKFEGNLADMLVAYNAGPGRARAWIAGGRRMQDLPIETQHYLEHAERLGALSEGYNWRAADQSLTHQGDSGDWVPPAGRAPAIRFELPAQAGGEGGGKPPGPPGEAGLPGEAIPPEPEGEKPFPLNADMLRDQILDIVGDPEERSAFDWLNPRKLISEFQAQLTPARRLDRRMGVVGPNELNAEDMLRQTYGSAGRAEHFVRWGILDPLTFAAPDRAVAVRPGEQLRLTGPRSDASIMAAYRQVKADGGNSQDFMAYLLAKRTIEKRDQGVDTGVDADRAETYLARRQQEDGSDRYAKGAAIWREVTDATVDYARDSNMFSEAQAEAMKNLNQSYITMRRVMDPEYTPPRPPGKSFTVRKPTRKMEGSDRQIINPLTATIDNIHTMVAMADRNRAIGHIINEGNNTRPGEPALFTQVKVWEPEVERPSDWDVRDEDGKPLHTEWFARDERGEYVPFSPDSDKALAMLDTYRTHNRALGTNEFVYFNKGRMEIWHTKDSDLADLMRMPWGPQSGRVAKIMYKVASLQRAGITSQLSFPFRAILHGQMASTVLSRTTNMVPYHDVMEGAHAAWGLDEDYRRWVANGGADAALNTMDENYIQHDVDRMFRETGTESAVWNFMRHPYDAYRTMVERFDSAARIGHFLRSESEGIDSMKAAMNSRMAYLDHAEPLANSWLQALSRMVPFMSVGWKDWQQFQRAITERPVGTITKAIALLTMPTVMNYAVNAVVDEFLDQKDRYSELPQWERDMYWVLPPIDGIRMKIPRPYVVGYAFATMPEHFIDYAWNHTVDAKSKLWDGFVRQAVPPFIPTLAYPGLESYMNKSFYTQSPLIKQSLEKGSGYMSYEPNTTETAKAIARILGPGGLALSQGPTTAPLANPVVTDEFIRQWAGPTPFYLLRALESPFKPADKPWEIADLPFVASFVARQPHGYTQSVQDFYTRLDSFTAAHADVRKAIADGNPLEAAQSEMLPAAIKLAPIATALQKQNAFLRAIDANPNMTNGEKRKVTDQATAVMVNTARYGLHIMESIGAH